MHLGAWPLPLLGSTGMHLHGLEGRQWLLSPFFRSCLLGWPWEVHSLVPDVQISLQVADLVGDRLA